MSHHSKLTNKHKSILAFCFNFLIFTLPDVILWWQQEAKPHQANASISCQMMSSFYTKEVDLNQHHAAALSIILHLSISSQYWGHDCCKQQWCRAGLQKASFHFSKFLFCAFFHGPKNSMLNDCFLFKNKNKNKNNHSTTKTKEWNEMQETIAGGFSNESSDSFKLIS